jgi:hypothetical protein
MVPVPEQYVERLKQEIMRIGIERAMAAWQADDVVGLLAELDPVPRELLALLAPARLTGAATSVTEAASALHCTADEVLAHVRDVNRRAMARGRPEMLIHDTRVLDTPSGPGPVRDHILMPPHVAKLVLDATRADT